MPNNQPEASQTKQRQKHEETYLWKHLIWKPFVCVHEKERKDVRFYN